MEVNMKMHRDYDANGNEIFVPRPPLLRPLGLPGCNILNCQIMRRNRIIDNIRHQFVPALWKDDETLTDLCKYLNLAADWLEKEEMRGALLSNLFWIRDRVMEKKLQVAYGLPVLFMRDRYPVKYRFLCRCKQMITSLDALHESIFCHKFPHVKEGETHVAH